MREVYIISRRASSSRHPLPPGADPPHRELDYIRRELRGLEAFLRWPQPGQTELAAMGLFNVAKSIAQVFSTQLTVTRIESLEMLETLRNRQVDLLQG